MSDIYDDNIPKIYIDFSIWGEKNISVGIDKIAELMNIPSAEIIKIGDTWKPKFNMVSKFDCYQIKTQECKTYEIEKEIKKIISLLEHKIDTINYIYNNFENIIIVLCVVVNVYNGIMPIFALSNKTIQFISDIKANFDIDLFINPWNGEN